MATTSNFFQPNAPASATPASTPAAASLTAAPSFNWNPSVGGIPSPASPQATQSASIGGNLDVLSQLYALATGTGTASGAGGAANLNAALPGATGALGSEVNLATSELGGNIDQPTINNLEQLAAERGVSTGSIGSPNSTAALMQALGRTTQGTEQLGVQNLTSAIGSAPVGPQFNPSSLFVSPDQQQQAQTYANTLAAAPVPSYATNSNLNSLLAGRGSAPAPAPGSPLAAAMGQPMQQQQPVGPSGFPNNPPVGTPSPYDVNYNGGAQYPSYGDTGWTTDENDAEYYD